MTKKLIRIVENQPARPSIYDQIQTYASQQGMVKKEGGYFFQDGRYAGSIYQIGKLAGIDMMDHR